MSYFKKFADFCSGFSAFTAVMYLFGKYMMFDFGEEELGMKDKLGVFFSKMISVQNHMMLILAIAFIVSVIAGRIFARLPYVAVIFVVPPMLLSVDMIKAELIEEYPMLYVILGAVAVIGGAFDCIFRDRDDRKHRSAYASAAVGAMFSAFCFFVARKSVALSGLDETAALELDRFDHEIFAESANMDMKLFYVFAAVYALLAVICLFLADVYFIGALLAIPPAVSLIYMWGAGKLTVQPEMLVTFSLIYLAMCVIPAVSGKAFYKQKPKKQ